MSDELNPVNLEHMKLIADKVLEKAKELNCPHNFNGEIWYSEDGRTGSVTCSVCGLPEIYYDMRRLP